MKFKTKEELLEYTDNIKGKTFEEIDEKNLLKTNNLKRRKGLLGHVVETGFYKYEINSDSKSDFDNLNIELKVSGYNLTKNGKKVPKERLVLSKIDYNGIINEEFDFSKLISKNENILIIWYEYDKNKKPKDFLITDYQLYNLKQDYEIIKNDFEIIKNKVINGKAHELSEGITSYLGACTKARTSKDRTEQPNSDILAKPRAFSLKQGYMRGILNEINSKSSKKNYESKTILKYVTNKFKPYFGKTQVKIYEELFNETPNKIPKNINKIISDKILGKDSELKEKNELFKKTNYLIKNVPLQENGKLKERMAFRNLRLSEFEEDWEDSYWKNYFEENTFITICYKETEKNCKNGFRKLFGIKQITFDENELDLLKETYNQVQETIKTKDISKLPTPNSFDNQILEIAPKTQKGKNIYENFLDNENTKVCFMLNKNYLNTKLKKLDYVNI